MRLQARLIRPRGRHYNGGYHDQGPVSWGPNTRLNILCGASALCRLLDAVSTNDRKCENHAPVRASDRPLTLNSVVLCPLTSKAQHSRCNTSGGRRAEDAKRKCKRKALRLPEEAEKPNGQSKPEQPYRTLMQDAKCAEARQAIMHGQGTIPASLAPNSQFQTYIPQHLRTFIQNRRPQAWSLTY